MLEIEKGAGVNVGFVTVKRQALRERKNAERTRPAKASPGRSLMLSKVAMRNQSDLESVK